MAGDVVFKDLDKAEKYLQQAADDDNEFAMYSLAKLYLLDYKKDLAKAVKWLEKACEHESIKPYAAYAYAKILLDDNEFHDTAKAIELLEDTADENNWCAYLLGKLYLFGNDDVEKDKQKAIEWLTKSGNDGNAYAEALLQHAEDYERSVMTNIDQAAYEFFSSYREYQQTHYPTLDLRTNKSSNGWWPQYGSVLGQTLIYHKMQEGYVDLTFPNTAEQMDIMQEIASWLRDNGNDQITAVRTGKSISLRIECPKLKVKEDFEHTSPNDLNVCFDAISRLTEIAAIFAKAGRMSTLTKGEQ